MVEKVNKTSGEVLKQRYNETDAPVQTVSSLMTVEDTPVQSDTSLTETLKNIYNSINGKINVEYKNNRLSINGINHPVEIGLNLLGNLVNKDKVPVENIIFNRNNTVGVSNGTVTNIYENPEHVTEVITMGDIKYYLMPRNLKVSTDQMKAIHKLEIANKSKWPHMLSDVIRDAYSDKIVNYSMMIATLNLLDEEIYMPADVVLETAIQNGFISLNGD